MRIMTNRNIRKLFITTGIAILAAFAAGELYSCFSKAGFSLPFMLITLLPGAGVHMLLSDYFRTQDKDLEAAAEGVKAFLAGDRSARLHCDEDGEMYRLFHEINTMASVLAAQNEREMTNNETLKRTVADISHQLKTPLAALNIYNGLIAEADSLEDVKKFTVSVDRELDRIGNLIKELMTLTRLDAGAVVFRKTEESVADMFEDISGRFAARTASENKTITLSGSEAAVLVCDRGWISEAFSNIIQNALDHTSAGGEIDVRWAMSGNMLSVTVSDNGSGIKPEDIGNIFKRFYRSRDCANRQGTGLGLPLAKTIIDAHGGTILVDSRPGKGSIFTVNFLNPAKM